MAISHQNHYLVLKLSYWILYFFYFLGYKLSFGSDTAVRRLNKLFMEPLVNHKALRIILVSSS